MPDVNSATKEYKEAQRTRDCCVWESGAGGVILNEVVAYLIGNTRHVFLKKRKVIMLEKEQARITLHFKTGGPKKSVYSATYSASITVNMSYIYLWLLLSHFPDRGTGV